MTLELTMQQMFNEQPMRFKERADCLNHLFCVVGNGYQWINGELVEIDRIISEKDVNTLQKQLIHEKAFQHNKLSIQDEIVQTFEASMRNSLSEFEDSEVLRRAMDKHIERLRSQYPDDVYHEHPRAERWDYSKLPYFKKYAKLFNYPDNIKEDWLSGIEECKMMLREDGFDI